MRTADQVRWDFVQGWLRKAEHDLGACDVLLAHEFQDYAPAAFHAQQAVEKFIKAFLVRHQVEFPKSHDLSLLRLLIAEENSSLAENLAAADDLTPYAVEFRYPGEMLVSKEEAQHAEEIARQVRNLVLAAIKDYLDKGRPA